MDKVLEYLKRAVEDKASDLFIVAGGPEIGRAHV